MSNAVAAHHLVQRFGRNTVLNGVDLEVPEGAVFALLGSNGVGKTTLLRTLVNILQPKSGRCEVLGASSTQLAPVHFEQIGYVSENQQMPRWMTVGELLGYCRPFYRAWDDALASQLVREFELPLDRKLQHLSRGMWMKAALTSSLAYKPKLILLDEPFSGLDPLVREELSQTLAERSAGATVVVSSHDLADIETFASHVGYLENGRIQFVEEIAGLYARFREVEVTLDETAAMPATVPGSWLNLAVSGRTARFVATQYDPAATAREVATLFPNATVASQPMNLRSIFIALARQSRGAAA